MAINKKLIHFNLYSNFITKKLSANVDNTQYTIGVDGTVYNVDIDNKPDILYHSIVFIKDVSKIWTHGQIYNCDGGITIVDSVDKLDPDAEQGSLATLAVNVPDIARPIEEYYIKSTEKPYLIKSLEYKESTEEGSFDVVFGAYGLDNNSVIPVEQMLNIYGDINNLNVWFNDGDEQLISEGELNTESLNKICESISSLGGVVLYGAYADGNDTHVNVTDIDEHSLWLLNQAFNFICAGTQETTLYIKDVNGWRNINEIKIVDSVIKLDKNASQGSLASVAVNTVNEVNFSELHQPISDEVNTETWVVDTTNLSRVSGISVNSSYDTSAEVVYFDVLLFSKDIDFINGFGLYIDLLPEVCYTGNLTTQEEQELLLFTTNEDGTIIINEENLAIINNLLSSTEFVYGGVAWNNGDNDERSCHPCVDEFYKATSIIQKTELYIKDVNGWKELEVGGSTVETVDNLEDTSTDKALSANMGRVLNERITAASSGSVTSVAGTLNIKDLNAVKAAQELLSNNQQVTYIITDANGNYPSPNNQTVYLDTEDHILDILYRGNGDALKWLLKNKQAYYNYSGSWYSQTISGDLVKLPSLHLRTAQVGDLITLIRQDIPAEEFYSNFVDYNNINLNLGTTEKLAFDAYLTSVGIKGALESISDGEAIRRLVEGGYIYSSEGDPNNGYTPNKLVSDGGLVTLYTAQITPNIQHLYNGEFWTGNMTGAGIYSYINNPDPAIPDREEGEVYTGYVSPDGTQTLVSMKNPFKTYKKVNNAWEKLETDTNYKTRYGWGTSLDSMLKTGVCAYTPATVAGMDANWTIFVTCSSDGDPTYYHLMQTAICRNDDMLGRIFQRMGWYKGNGEDLHFTDWKEVGGGSSSGDNYHCAIHVDNDTVLEVNSELGNTTTVGYSLLANSDEQTFPVISFIVGDNVIGVIHNDFIYTVYKGGEEEWIVDKAPAYKADPIHCAIDIDSNTAELYVEPRFLSYVGYTALVKSSEEGEFELLEIVPSIAAEGMIYANASDTNYIVSILDEEGNTEVQAVPRHSNRFLTTESVEQGEAVTEYTLMTRDIAQELGNDETKVMSQKAVTDAINNAIINTLNTEV